MFSLVAGPSGPLNKNRNEPLGGKGGVIEAVCHKAVSSHMRAPKIDRSIQAKLPRSRSGVLRGLVTIEIPPTFRNLK